MLTDCIRILKLRLYCRSSVFEKLLLIHGDLTLPKKHLTKELLEFFQALKFLQLFPSHSAGLIHANTLFSFAVKIFQLPCEICETF